MGLIKIGKSFSRHASCKADMPVYTVLVSRAGVGTAPE